MWFTPTTGMPVATPSAFANETPTRRLPMSPGPCVTDMRSMSSSVLSARRSASFKQISIASMCILEAISGTTPPYFRCVSIWLCTTFERTLFGFSTTAMLVSSQLVSIANVNISSTPSKERPLPLHSSLFAFLYF